MKRNTHFTYWITGLAIVSMGAAYSVRSCLEIGPVATVTGGLPRILLLDTDVGDPDWEIGNSANGNAFEIGLNNTNVQPFSIGSSAEDGALSINSGGVSIKGDLSIQNQPTDSIWELIAANDQFSLSELFSTPGSFFLQRATPLVIETSAPDDSFYMNTSGDISMGASLPDSSLHVYRDDGSAQLKVEDASTAVGNRDLMELVNNGGVRFALDNIDRNERWEFSNNSIGDFNINRAGTGGPEMRVTRTGRLTSGPGGFVALDSRPNGNLFIAGTLFESSDREKKENFEAVDCDEILAQVANLPITTWNYKSDEEEIRHMGPVAQDFRSTFQLGDSDKTIATTDKAGVSLAAIKALNSKLEAEAKEKDQQIDALNKRLQKLESALLQMAR